MTRASKRRNKRQNKLEIAFVTMVLCTFFIVFALVINIRSNNARKEKLATAEQELQRSEEALAMALEVAKHREQTAQDQLDKAEGIIEEYETSLSESIIAQHKSRLLIGRYEVLNKDLLTSLEKTDTLGKKHQEQLVEVKKLRERTLNYKRNVLNFYHKTREDQREATAEIAKAKRAYSVSLERLNRANALTEQASETLEDNRYLANRVDSLEADLSRSESNNIALQGQVNQANYYIDVTRQTKRVHQHCPPKQSKPKTCAKPKITSTKKPLFR